MQQPSYLYIVHALEHTSCLSLTRSHWYTGTLRSLRQSILGSARSSTCHKRGYERGEGEIETLMIPLLYYDWSSSTNRLMLPCKRLVIALCTPLFGINRGIRLPKLCLSYRCCFPAPKLMHRRWSHLGTCMRSDPRLHTHIPRCEVQTSYWRPVKYPYLGVTSAMSCFIRAKRVDLPDIAVRCCGWNTSTWRRGICEQSVLL